MKSLLVRCGAAQCSLNQLLQKNGSDSSFIPWKQQPDLLQWIQEVAVLCLPKEIQLCDGSEEEYQLLCQQLVDRGVFVSLDPIKRPRSYWCHSDENDVARVEEATFICSKTEKESGPTNNWKEPQEMKEILLSVFKGSMRGRTLYVVPFCMGPLHSPFSIIGVEITDSPYVVCNMRIMTTMGISVLEMLRKKRFFVPCLHSVGKPLQEGEADVAWPCNPKKYIVHFPEELSIWSFGSGYGGNALLGKKSLALRIASVIAKKEGWLAEHMLIIGVTNPEGKKKYMAAAFPSQCGKTNLALLSPTLPGWKVECVGDDIAWIRVGKGGDLYAVNPEKGFFGVAPGTSYTSNANAMATISRDTLFTNVALTQEGDVWWEGLSKEPPQGLITWKGRPYQSNSSELAAHSNSRFTVGTEQCPIIDSKFRDPEGVPLSAILFGGRRSSTMPLVCEARSWRHGVFFGASISSETTSAATGTVGKLRHDPFAMLPFCGYHMGDYFSHWLEMGDKIQHPPAIFYVNWFRKNENGEFLWPGFGENIRVLAWIFERIEGKINYIDVPMGYVPAPGALNLQGLSTFVDSDALFAFSSEEWKKEVEEMERYFPLFGEKLPSAFGEEIQSLKQRVDAFTNSKS